MIDGNLLFVIFSSESNLLRYWYIDLIFSLQCSRNQPFQMGSSNLNSIQCYTLTMNFIINGLYQSFHSLKRGLHQWNVKQIYADSHLLEGKKMERRKTLHEMYFLLNPKPMRGSVLCHRRHTTGVTSNLIKVLMKFLYAIIRFGGTLDGWLFYSNRYATMKTNLWSIIGIKNCLFAACHYHW